MLFRSFTQENHAKVSLAGLVQPRIEPEICFKLKAPPPLTRDPAALLAAIEWVAHSIEIVQCHHPDWKVTIADCTADNGLHGRLIVGTPVQIGEIPRLASLLPLLRVTLRKGNEVKDQGVGANVLDSPLLSLAFLVDVLAKQSGSPLLEAGEIVTTGTLTDAHPVKAGEAWSTAVEGLPVQGLSLSFE